MSMGLMKPCPSMIQDTRTYGKVVGGEVLKEDAVVDGGESIGSGEAEREDTEVSLKARVDGETAGGRVHARHVLRVVDVLERQLGPVVPVTVVEVLADQRVRLHGEILVDLHHHQQTASPQGFIQATFFGGGGLPSKPRKFTPRIFGHVWGRPIQC